LKVRVLEKRREGETRVEKLRVEGYGRKAK